MKAGSIAESPSELGTDTGKLAGCGVYPGYNVDSIRAGPKVESPGKVGSITGKEAGCCVYPGYNVGSIKAGPIAGSPGKLGSVAEFPGSTNDGSFEGSAGMKSPEAC
jgi:hypothetical protein